MKYVEFGDDFAQTFTRNVFPSLRIQYKSGVQFLTIGTIKGHVARNRATVPEPP
jgi:hypothetical protein